jgi:hypothetical protein
MKFWQLNPQDNIKLKRGSNWGRVGEHIPHVLNTIIQSNVKGLITTLNFDIKSKLNYQFNNLDVFFSFVFYEKNSSSFLWINRKNKLENI